MIGRTSAALALGALLAACSSAASQQASGVPFTGTSIPPVVETVAPSTTASTLATTTTVDPRPNATELAVGAQFINTAQSLMAADDVHAISVTVLRGEYIVTESAQGVDTTGAPLTTASPFRLASVSKPLLAATVLLLADEGMIDLDATLASQWTDRFAVTDARVRAITVRQLLQHTSGLDAMRNTFFFDGGIEWRGAADIALATTLLHDPGTGYRYSNANYVLLGRLVEQRTGSTVDAVIATKVLQPLGVTAARMNADTHSFATNGPRYIVGRAREYLEALGPAGSWEMSAHDMAMVMTTLAPASANPLLSPESLNDMLTRTTLDDGEDAWDYGLGMMVGAGWWGHTGSIEDVSTFAIDLHNGYTVVVLAATDEVTSGGALMERFAAPLAALLALPQR